MVLQILTLLFWIVFSIACAACLVFVVKKFFEVLDKAEADEKAEAQIDQAEPDFSRNIMWLLSAIYQVATKLSNLKKLKQLQKEHKRLMESNKLLTSSQDPQAQQTQAAQGQVTLTKEDEHKQEQLAKQEKLAKEIRLLEAACNQNPLALAQFIGNCIEEFETYHAHKTAVARRKSLEQQTQALKAEEIYEANLMDVEAQKRAKGSLVDIKTQGLIAAEQLKVAPLQKQIEEMENPGLAKAKDEAREKFKQDLVKSYYAILADNYMKFGKNLDRKEALEQDKERRKAEAISTISDPQKRQEAIDDIEAAYAECLKEESKHSSSPKATAKKFGVRL